MISVSAGKFLVSRCEKRLNITKFFPSTCKIFSDVSCVLNKKDRFDLRFDQTIDFFEILLTFEGFSVSFFFVTILTNVSLTLLDYHSVGY